MHEHEPYQIMIWLLEYISHIRVITVYWLFLAGVFLILNPNCIESQTFLKLISTCTRNAKYFIQQIEYR